MNKAIELPHLVGIAGLYGTESSLRVTNEVRIVFVHDGVKQNLVFFVSFYQFPSRTIIKYFELIPCEIDFGSIASKYPDRPCSNVLINLAFFAVLLDVFSIVLRVLNVIVAF
jgi:hypothetical protein